jgi:hypothetical protein
MAVLIAPLLTSLLLANPAPPAAAEPAATVRLYRCVSSNGAIALQDAPCASGEQQVLDMQRPKDPTPRTAPVTVQAPASATPPRQVQRGIAQQPPRPMYECVSPDGERYSSDTAEGNPRWVPIWVHGGVPAHSHRPQPGPPGHRPSPVHGSSVIVPAGATLVRDTCHPLPQREVCDRLGDQRWELIRRYTSALQSERQTLQREQRSIEARVAQDCRDY